MPSIPFNLLPTPSPNSRPTSRPPSRANSPRPSCTDNSYDSSDDGPSTSSWRTASSYAPSPHHHHHYHNNFFAQSTSNLISARQTPVPSRSSSPAPPYVSDYFANSEEDQEPSALLGRNNSVSYLPISNGPPPRPKWWTDASGRRVRKRVPHTPHIRSTWRRIVSKTVRHPLFPTQRSSILIAFVLFAAFGISVTLLLMYILNPDKVPLPWRSYCSLSPPFPAAEIAKLPPVGVFLGVMSTDSSVERRMIIRSTWAKHVRSRGTDGSTDRTIVRFILGTPRNKWTRRIQLEAETYNDMVILPVPENMNNGKTHAYISWAHANALVPPPLANETGNPFSDPSITFPHASPYVTGPSASILRSSAFPSFARNNSGPAPPLAPHDPQRGAHPTDAWVRPQFVIKADDDAFVMLAELEARLRLEWYEALKDAEPPASTSVSRSAPQSSSAALGKPSPVVDGHPRMTKVLGKPTQPTARPSRFTPRGHIFDGGSFRSAIPIPKNVDPMIYWGYLVKARFMAGELYALSSALVEYIATTPELALQARGKEDKQTAKWIRMHPRAGEVRWKNERCWIYDHPRANTVYSHGFLFPSEAQRVRHETTHGLTPAQIHLLPTSTSTSDPSLTHSTVSRFGVRYVPPSTNLTTEQEVEALIEGSPLSRLRDETIGGSEGAATPEEVRRAWRRRELRQKRFPEGAKVGGTIVVHYIKSHEWYLETALAFLGGEDEEGPVDVIGEIEEEQRKDVSDLEWIAKGASGGSTSSSSSKSKTTQGRPNRYETDLSNKSPLDLSHLDVDEEPAGPVADAPTAETEAENENPTVPEDVGNDDVVVAPIEQDEQPVDDAPEDNMDEKPTEQEEIFPVMESQVPMAAEQFGAVEG